MVKIELEEIELSVDDMYKIEKYNGDGLYFVSDGVAFYIVSVLGMGFTTIPIIGCSQLIRKSNE